MSWSKVESFNIGPVDQLRLNSQVNTFPLNNFGLENFINSRNNIVSNDLLALPANQVGLPALEYLLFEPEAQEKLMANPVRIEMILALAQRQNDIANTIVNQWQSNYRTAFVSATGKDVGGSVTVLVNAMLQFSESARTFKIATPLGFTTDGTIRPDLVETPYRNISKELLIENLAAIQEIFNGNGTVGDSNGFDDYLDELNIRDDDELLSTAINNQFTITMASINNIPGTLQEALTTNPMEINFALSEWQRLVVLLKTDMTSQLGLIVTFGDNDGD